MFQLLSIAELSLILSFVSVAAVLTFRFAGFPDLSVDGVFALGAVVFARVYSDDLGISASLASAALAGALVGATTAGISVRLRINPILASVLMLTMLYSLNLRVLGQANLPIYSVLDTVFARTTVRIALYSALALALFVATVTFFRTHLGAALRATGSAPEFLVSVGRNVNVYRVFLVALAGMLVSVSGALLTIKSGYADVSMGVGVIIIGIASLIIGEKIVGRSTLLTQILSAYLGVLLYELAVGVALSIGVSPIDVKLGTGIITILLLALAVNDRDKMLA